jgi:hypothetical protein
MSFYGLVALDLANDRMREEMERTARHAVAREAGRMGGPARPPRRSSVRALLAGPVRAFGDAAHSLSHVAGAAASRIEGGTA